MADDINNNEGMGEAGDAGMPDDLKRLLARAEQGEDGDPDSYNPDAEDEEDEDDDAELEESFGAVDRGARPARISTAASSRFRSSAAR